MRLDDVRRQRRRPLLVQRRHEHVRGHDEAPPAASMAARNGTNSTCAQPLRRVLDERQLEVRVGAGVAVPREVLAARGDALALQRADDGRRRGGATARPCRQRAVADDRVLRIGVDVEHRRVVERDADRLQLRGQRAGEALGERDVAAAAERRHRRPLGERLLQPRDAAAFLVDADPGRAIARRARSSSPRELGDLLGRLDVAREEDGAAEPELARQRIAARRAPWCRRSCRSAAARARAGFRRACAASIIIRP